MPHDGHFLQAVAHVLGEAMTRKRAEEQRAGLLVRERAARAHAEAASRAKEDLLATVSHELRAPLAQLVTWSRLLRRGKVDETALEAIDRSTRTLERLAGDLLDVARITAGKLSLAIRPIVLGGTVSGALDALRPAADACVHFHPRSGSRPRLMARERAPATEVVTGPIATFTFQQEIEFFAGGIGLPPAVAVDTLNQILSLVGMECRDLNRDSYGLVEVSSATGTATITLKDDAGHLVTDALTGLPCIKVVGP